MISAMAHGAQVQAVDPPPAAALILRVQAPGAWPPASPSDNGATLSWLRADPRRYLRAAGPAFDAIIEELPFPAATPEWARLTTREAFQELRGRLGPGGLAALRLPAPYPPQSLAKTLRTARSVFAHVGGYELPGGYLLACSDQPLAAEPAALLARASAFVQADDMRLEDELPKLRWDDLTDLPAPAAASRPDTDDRPSGFFLLPAWAGRLALAHSVAEALGGPAPAPAVR
jgi:SAM-dependent methyltransferase